MGAEGVVASGPDSTGRKANLPGAVDVVRTTKWKAGTCTRPLAFP
jgi:hypothetical protein